MKCDVCSKEFTPSDEHQRFEKLSITYSIVSGEIITEEWNNICPSCKDVIANTFVFLQK